MSYMVTSSKDGKKFQASYPKTKAGADKEYQRRYTRGHRHILMLGHDGELIKRYDAKIVSPAKKGSYTFKDGQFKRNPGMRYGTSYFVSRSAALRYYRPYGNDAANVDQKIREGEIHIGKPPLKAGDRLSVIPGEGRYQIEEGSKGNPRAVYYVKSSDVGKKTIKAFGRRWNIANEGWGVILAQDVGKMVVDAGGFLQIENDGQLRKRLGSGGGRVNPRGMRAGLASMYELFYSYGGHGGPYSSIAEAEKWARNLIKGDPHHLKWVDIKRYSHRGRGGYGATVKRISAPQAENPSLSTLPRNKWTPAMIELTKGGKRVKGMVRVTSNGDVQAKLPRAVVQKINPQVWYNVRLDGKLIDKVQYSSDMSLEDVKRSLVNRDGYDTRIKVIKEQERKKK